MIVPMNKAHWDVLNLTLPLALQEDTRGVVCVDDDTGEVYGGVVCEDWTSTVCCVHIVITHRRALREGIHSAAASYVFTQAGRLKMLGYVPADNEKALKLNKHLGFTELVRIEDGYKLGVDYVLMELKRENCPYWRLEDGKEERARAA